MLSTLIVAALALSAGAAPHSKTNMVKANEHRSKSHTTVFHSAQTPHATADDDFFTDDAQGHLRSNKKKIHAEDADFYATAAPSFEPTTAVPSFEPTTAVPSQIPTAAPTLLGDTFSPTFSPSHAPTPAPTFRKIETVIFSNSQEISGIECTDFDAPAQAAFVNVTATNMEVDESSIKNFECADSISDRRRLADHSVELDFEIEYVFDATTQTAAALDVQVKEKFASTDQTIFAADFKAKAIQGGSVGVTVSTTIVTSEPELLNVTVSFVEDTFAPTHYPTRAPTGNSAPASAAAASAMWVTMLCAAVASAVYLV